MLPEAILVGYLDDIAPVIVARSTAGVQHDMGWFCSWGNEILQQSYYKLEALEYVQSLQTSTYVLVCTAVCTWTPSSHLGSIIIRYLSEKDTYISAARPQGEGDSLCRVPTPPYFMHVRFWPTLKGSLARTVRTPSKRFRNQEHNILLKAARKNSDLRKQKELQKMVDGEWASSSLSSYLATVLLYRTCIGWVNGSFLHEVLEIHLGVTQWTEERGELTMKLQETDLQPQTIIGVMLRGQKRLVCVFSVVKPSGIHLSESPTFVRLR
ncbi:hypothetical protein J6590_047438 [Homalodisca vitripennis]|nr:hypothetical protein J6590_047438 [Homalodisca vitripennis]